jgi:hypothetical protein
MDWKLEGLSTTAASFIDAREETAGALGIEVAFAGSVHVDPCHRGGPLQAPVPTSVDGMVKVLINVVGFTVSPHPDTHISGRATEAFRLDAEGNRVGRDCAAYAENWVVDVDGTPVVIRATSFDRIVAGGLTLIDTAESISFD